MREIRTTSLCVGAWPPCFCAWCLTLYFSRLFRRVVPGARLHTRPNRQSDIGRHFGHENRINMAVVLAWCTCLVTECAVESSRERGREKNKHAHCMPSAQAKKKKTALNSLACRAWPVCSRVIEAICGVKLLNSSCMTAINAAQNRNDGDLSLPISHAYARQHAAGCHAPLGPIIGIRALR